MEFSANSPARIAERALFYGWVPVFVLALWPHTLNPCEPPKLLVTAIMVLGCSVLAFFSPSGRRGAGLGALLALWLGWQFVCGLGSGLPENSLWSLTLPAAWVLAALAARRAFSEPDRAWRLVAVMVAALTAASLYGFAQLAGWDPFPWSSTTTTEYRGLPSSFGHPNFAGHALVPGIILALALATRARMRIPALAAALIMATHLWFTGMRGGPVALAAALTLFGAWMAAGWLRGARPGRIPLALLLTVLVGLAATAAGLSAYRATHGTWLPVSDSSLVLRYNSAHGAARIILDHPAMGVGLGNYEAVNAAWWTPFEQRWYALRALRNDHVHCEFLEAGAEGGLPGVFLHFLLFSWALLAGLRLAGGGTTPALRGLGLAVALCAFAMGIDGLFGFNLHVPVSAGLFFVLLGVLDGVIGGLLPSHPVRGPITAFAGMALGMVLAVAVLAGAIGHFRVDRLALRDQAMFGQWSALPAGGADRSSLQNALLQQLMLDRRAFPMDRRFFEYQGRVCLGAGDFGAAADAFSNALAKYPANPDTLADLAKALHGQAAGRAGMGDWSGAAFLLQRAECAAERARDLCPPLAAPHDALWRIADLRAEMARSLGLDDKAQDQRVVEEAHTALQCGVPDVVPVYRALARIALRGERYDEAAELVGHALDHGPDAFETWRLVETLSAFAQARPQLLDAVSRAYAALKQGDSGTAAVLRAAWWLTRLYADDPDMALAVARGTIQAHPGELGAWGLLAQLPGYLTALPERVCAEHKRLSAEIGVKPIPAFVEALCSDPPPNAGALVQIAEELVAKAANMAGPSPQEGVKRELSWAVPLLKTAAEKSGATAAERAGIGAACAIVYNTAQMWPETEATCAEALPNAAPDAQATLYLLRSNALAQLSRKDEALAAAREAAQSAPNRMDVQWNLAQRLTEAGNNRESVFVYKTLIQQLPNTAPQYGRIAQEYTRVLQQLQTPAPGASP